MGLLFEYGTLNGGEFSILAVIPRLQRRGVFLSAACPEDTPLAHELKKLGVETGDPIAELAGDDQFADRLHSWADNKDLQLIHANSLAMGRKLGRVCDRLTIPTSCHLRDIIKLSRSAIDDLNRHSGRVAVSQAVREFHLRQGLSESETMTIFNGVNLERFSPGSVSRDLREELSLPPETRFVTNVGQICLRKGQDDFAQAVALLAKDFPDVQFLLVGERHSQKAESVRFDKQIDEIIRSAGIAGRFHRLGFRRDLTDIFRQTDVLLHTARQEPLGRVLLEAAATETAIVATDVGGTAEILEDGVSAILVPSKSPEQAAQAVRRLLQDDKLRTGFRRNARLAIETRFDVNRSADALEPFWREVISRGVETRGADSPRSPH
ncbi:MAG: glycosyltransferase family 4 protein [Planctomycetaceae bacterium]|nr:glycosyltransferase family 4 protein [Planctomycetaceae bacterium]